MVLGVGFRASPRDSQLAMLATQPPRLVCTLRVFGFQDSGCGFQDLDLLQQRVRVRVVDIGVGVIVGSGCGVQG